MLRSLLLVALLACVGGACYLAAPVIRKTWPTMLVALAVAIALGGVRVALSAKGQIVADRRRRGLCVGCGYDLTGNVSDVCPECGAAKR